MSCVLRFGCFFVSLSFSTHFILMSFFDKHQINPLKLFLDSDIPYNSLGLKNGYFEASPHKSLFITCKGRSLHSKVLYPNVEVCQPNMRESRATKRQGADRVSPCLLLLARKNTSKYIRFSIGSGRWRRGEKRTQKKRTRKENRNHHNALKTHKNTLLYYIIDILP